MPLFLLTLFGKGEKANLRVENQRLARILTYYPEMRSCKEVDPGYETVV